LIAPGAAIVKIDTQIIKPEGVLITPLARENGVTYYVAASYLKTQGALTEDDPRLGAAVMRDDDIVASTAKGFGARVTHLQEALKGIAADAATKRKIKSLLATQKKVCGEDPSKISPNGDQAAQVALCMEKAAMLIPQSGHEDLVTGCLSFAATTTDRCVYEMRHKGFDGLVAPLAYRHQTSVSDMAKELVRAGKIPADDPRATAVPQRNGRSGDLMTKPFMDYVKSSLASSVIKARSIENATFGRRAIFNEVAEMKVLPKASSKASGGDDRARDFMLTIAKINERVAMNVHLSGGDPATVSSTLELADSASRRAMVYDMRSKARAIDEHSRASRKSSNDARN
jgi:hypothetical protein